ELAPNDADAANNLAWLLAQDSSTARRALDLARRVTVAAADDARCWDTRAEAARRAGEIDEAGAAWTKALRLLAPESGGDAGLRAEIALRYGQFLRERGQDDAAREVVKSALAGVKGAPTEGALRKFLGE